MLWLEWRKRIHFFHTLLFPSFCLNCGCPGNYLCADCFLFLNESQPSCFYCGQLNRRGLACPDCVAGITGFVSAWEQEGLTDKIVDFIRERELTEVLDFLTDRALLVFIDNKSFDLFWLTWFSFETDIIPFRGSETTQKDFSLNQRMANRLIGKTNRDKNKINGAGSKKAILIALVGEKSISLKARQLADQGYDEIWALVLTHNSC
jgi:hypothetical protein